MTRVRHRFDSQTHAAWTRMVLALCASLIFLAGSLTPASAQIPLTGLSASCRAPDFEGACEDIPEGCDLSSYEPLTGIYEFLFHAYPVFDQGPGLGNVTFQLSAPQDWTVLDWSSCRGVLRSGDPTALGSEISMDFQDCIAGPPLLRMLIDCPSAGRLGFSSIEISCDGRPTERWGNYVDIGERCGRLSLDAPCQMLQCDVLAGHFSPSRVSARVEVGEQWSQTIQMWTGTCPSLPECGTLEWGCPVGAPGNGYPWIIISDLTPDYRSFLLTLDATDLEPGYYEGTLEMSASLCCRRNCMTVSLIVDKANPVVPRTWGSLKSRR